MKPTATLTPDGQAYDLNATAVLLILADTAHGDGSHDTTPTGQARAAKTVADMLAAAAAGGYRQADILETLLLAQGELTTPRVRAMAVQACEAAGTDSLCKIFDAMRAMRKP